MVRIHNLVELRKIRSDITRCVNIGAQAVVASTLLEKHIGFWVAFLICTCAIFIGLVLLFLGRKHYGEIS